MTKLTIAQQEKAARTFLAGHPDAALRVMALTEADADVMETTLDQLRLHETISEISKYAHLHGRDSMEMLYSLAAENFEEFERMCEDRRQTVKDHLGL